MRITITAACVLLLTLFACGAAEERQQVTNMQMPETRSEANQSVRHGNAAAPAQHSPLAEPKGPIDPKSVKRQAKSFRVTAR